jgi:hypothetical protein
MLAELDKKIKGSPRFLRDWSTNTKFKIRLKKFQRSWGKSTHIRHIYEIFGI